MAIPRRLNSGNRFERSQNRDVKRVVFLSVEGNVTEPQYFGYVKAFQKELGIKSVVELHVLQRQDTSSSPFKVLELLENYLEIRNNSNFSSEIDKLDFKNYTKEFIQNYLDDKGSLPQKEVRKFEALLREQQLDLAYLYFLNKSTSNNVVRYSPIFCILVASPIASTRSRILSFKLVLRLNSSR